MGEYLAKAVGLPSADSAITKVNAAVTAIEEALADPMSDWTEVVQKATSARDAIAERLARIDDEQEFTNNRNSSKVGEGNNQESPSASKLLLDQNLSEAEILENIANNYASKVKDLSHKATLNAALSRLQFEISKSSDLLTVTATSEQFVNQREKLGSSVDELMSALRRAGFYGNTTVNGETAISASLAWLKEKQKFTRVQVQTQHIILQFIIS